MGSKYSKGYTSEVDHVRDLLASAAKSTADTAWSGAGAYDVGLQVIASRSSAFSDFMLKAVAAPDEPDGDTSGEAMLALIYGGWRDAENAGKTIGSAVNLWGAMAAETLPALVETGRLYRVNEAGHPDRDAPLDMEDEPRRLALRVEYDSARNVYRFAGVLLSSDRNAHAIEITGAENIHLHSDGWMIHGNALARYDQTHLPWLVAIKDAGGHIEITRNKIVDFFKEAGGAWSMPPLLDAHHLTWKIIQENEPVPVLTTNQTPTGHHAGLTFDYGGYRVLEGDANRVNEARERNGNLAGLIMRNHAAEAERVDQLKASGFHGMGGPPGRTSWIIDMDAAADAFARLLGLGWRIEVQSNRDGISAVNPVTDWNLRIDSNIDWFDLKGVEWGDASFRVSANVLVLIECIRNKRSFVQIEDRGMFLITREMRQLLQAAHASGERVDQAIRMNPGLAGLIFALEDNPKILRAAGGDAGVVDMLSRDAASGLKDFDAIQPAKPPPTFSGTLREYQKAGLGWLHFLRRMRVGGCLADDMGLGKTVQVIALLDHLRKEREDTGEPRRTSLVIAPRSLLENWFDEINRFAPGLRPFIHHGMHRHMLMRQFSSHDVIITTYGIITRDASLLAGFTFDYIILDEAHQIRNADTKTSRAVKQLKALHRLALTGTPVINYARDLKSLFDFLSPGLVHGIPSLAEFMRKGGPLGEEEAVKMGKYLRPFILRRTKEQVLEDLPAITEQVLYCELEGQEREAYNGMRDLYRRQLLQGIDAMGTQQYRMHVLAALTRLRQLACHPGMIDSGLSSGPSAKLNLLLGELDTVLADNHKVLVFSSFTTHLAIIRQHLEARQLGGHILYLDGQTQNRGEVVRSFQQDPNKRIFLISIKAGGLGLNLTAADYVFITDPWWNTAIEDQAIDRAHRIGQKNSVFAYRLIARDTIDEKVRQLQQRKQGLVNLIIDEKNANLSNLTREDLEFLLS